MSNILLFDFSGTLVNMRPPTLLIKRDVLERLSQKFKFGIITGGPRSETTNILKKLNIYSLFDPQLIITKDDTFLRKPDPLLITSFLKKVDSKKAIYIGDRSKDLKLAKAAKIPFIYVGKAKYGKIQLGYNYDLVEQAVNKLLSSGDTNE